MTSVMSLAMIASLSAQTMAHLTPAQLKSAESVDTMLAELTENKSTQAEVAWQIDYLHKIKELKASSSSSDLFGQRLIVAYPTLAGAESVKAIAKAMYPNEVQNKEKEAVRARVQDYFNMVSNLDTNIAKDLWAEQGDVSIITPRTQFFGTESIMNDFLIKTFSSMRSRKLHSLSEVINIYGESANVQLYWIFDTVDAKGEKHQTRGRESLIFEKIKGEWRLVHVHYSRM